MEMHNWYTKHSKKSYCNGPLGFPVLEDQAREIETLLKQAEKEGFGYSRQTFFDAPEFKSTEGETPEQLTTLICSTNHIDRDTEVVAQKGIDTTQYKKNMVLCWAHESSTLPPLGQGLWIKRTDDTTTKAEYRFAKRPTNHPEQAEWFPNTVYHLLKDRILRGVSIGFIGLEGGPPTTKEIEANPSWASVSRVIRKSLLLEVSIVPIGSNPAALVESVSKGLYVPEHLKQYGIELPQEEEWEWELEDFVIKKAEPQPTADPKTELLKNILKSMKQ